MPARAKVSVPREQRCANRVAVLLRNGIAQVIDDGVRSVRRARRILRREVPTRDVLHVARFQVVGREVQEALFEISDARIRDTRHVAVVRQRDEVVRHLDLEAARVGRTIYEIRFFGPPRLRHAKHVVFRERLRFFEERAIRVEVIAMQRIGNDVIERRRKIGDVRQERRRRDDDRIGILRGYRHYGDDR